MSNYLSLFNKELQQAVLNIRPGETKLGENISFATTAQSWQKDLQFSKSSFVLLGIPEDIGVRANGGIGGAHTVWEAALKSLLNIQSIDKCSGEELFVLGSFDFKAWMEDSVSMNTEQLRSLVTHIDEEVYPVIEIIIKSGKIPIVIGGGHNNAFPLLKGSALSLGAAVNCINLDAHSDYRIQEGRHSGNGFRYAKSENYLYKYAVVGLHENYNSKPVLLDMTMDKDIHYSFFEDIFIRNKMSFEAAIQAAIHHTQPSFTGIELDLDCIERVLSSAQTPSGISVLQARQYIYQCALYTKACYLHLTEGATALVNGKEDSSTGKLIAYLVSDFIKGIKPIPLQS